MRRRDFIMRKLFAVILTTIAAAVSTAASTGCVFALLDEPEMFD